MAFSMAKARSIIRMALHMTVIFSKGLKTATGITFLQKALSILAIGSVANRPVMHKSVIKTVTSTLAELGMAFDMGRVNFFKLSPIEIAKVFGSEMY